MEQYTFADSPFDHNKIDLEFQTDKQPAANCSSDKCIPQAAFPFAPANETQQKCQPNDLPFEDSASSPIASEQHSFVKSLDKRLTYGMASRSEFLSHISIKRLKRIQYIHYSVAFVFLSITAIVCDAMAQQLLEKPYNPLTLIHQVVGSST